MSPEEMTELFLPRVQYGLVEGFLLESYSYSLPESAHSLREEWPILGGDDAAL
jgi:hypothetical protein